jgi:hypothetical protein
MGYYGSDGPDTSPPTLNDCSTLAYQFVMESFFALISFIGSIHAGFKHYRTTLTGNAVVAATLDLEYPFLHFKGTDFAIVEAQEMALRCGYIAPSQASSSGVEMVSSYVEGHNDPVAVACGEMTKQAPVGVACIWNGPC